MLPPALQPQRTGANGFQPQSFSGQQIQAQNTGFGGPHAPNGFGGSPPPVPPLPPSQQQQQPSALQPLQPQKTGPAPPVRFGVTGGANKLMPQPTGRRANLSQASKCAARAFHFPTGDDGLLMCFRFSSSPKSFWVLIFFASLSLSYVDYPHREGIPGVKEAGVAQSKHNHLSCYSFCSLICIMIHGVHKCT